MQCGLLGEKLGHSYSPQIHGLLANYEYGLFEKKPDEVEQFIRFGSWHGLNVTIPYKKTVIPFCDELSETAGMIGSVNTLLRCSDGSIVGDNTDAFGFEMLLDSVLREANLSGKKLLYSEPAGHLSLFVLCCIVRELLLSRFPGQVIIIIKT